VTADDLLRVVCIIMTLMAVGGCYCLALVELDAWLHRLRRTRARRRRFR